ncbi:MAG: DNA alkylation repair protein, partial [Bacteroidota bacterium]
MQEISEEILNRKGVRKAVDIPADVLELLNTGRLETANLTEWLAVDQLKLLEVVLDGMGKGNDSNSFTEPIRIQKKPTANSNTKLIGHTFG